MNEEAAAVALDDRLKNQIIDDHQPGSILHDFQVILDFVGDKGIVTGGKHHTLPTKSIPELDERLSRPLRLDSKRPKIQSHPYLLGLNLVLRGTRLVRLHGNNPKARLTLDPEMMAVWNGMNPAERYFNLLESWMLHASPELIGASWSGSDDYLLEICLFGWKILKREGGKVELDDQTWHYSSGFYRAVYALALLDLFGLFKVEHAPVSAEQWIPTSIECTPFGDAVLSIIAAFHHTDGEIQLLDVEQEPDADDDDDEPPPFGPGLWQPLFQPYFPDWRANLEYPVEKGRDGVHVFRATLGDVWRLIAVRGEETVQDLVDMILKSIKFDDDHLYEIRFKDRQGVTLSVVDPRMNEGIPADEFEIGMLPIDPGKTMDMRYDFGADWRFQIKLERVEPPEADVKASRILEKHGKAPSQYGDDFF